MNIVYLIVFGLVVGFIANILDPDKDSGLLGTIILGVLGSILGGFLGELIFGTRVTDFNFSSFIVAVAGALILQFISRVFREV